MPRSIVIIGTLDTKSEEILFAKEQIELRGHKAIVMDMSVGSKPSVKGDITSQEVAREGGGDIKAIWGNPDRPKINKIITDGAIKICNELLKEGKLDGILCIGGAGGTLIGTDVMKGLPFGVPKFVISSNAALPGFSSKYFGTKDITMMHTMVDIAGLNDILKTLLSQAAGAICGMAEAFAMSPHTTSDAEKRKSSVALCELMASAKCISNIKRLLEENGYQVTVFMATGVGDTAMEELISQGLFDAVLDLSPGGIIDSFIDGGTRKACKVRLESAGLKGIPQVIVPGGLDFITPLLSKYKPEYDERKIFRPDKLRQLIRSNIDELTRAAEVIAKKLNAAKGPVKFIIPLNGWSRVDGPGRPLYDPEANAAFVKELRRQLKPEIEVREIDAWIEDPVFGDVLVEALNEMMHK
ncbi:MAG TPA: Tm-1-like ATP-binding domain-containing protein [Syntrophorhabdaceae bacterium]|nr:Tm-1-like ATP-binding domain-containing protein [Syntrophorhabdaceae bacterium]HQM80572.1 Tm-1-like ATP-binding domain-containing protein [Syntrophorhabdaceae bacterium]